MFYRNSEGKEFTFQLFISGDYEFLCYMYGLSGSSGTYFSQYLHVEVVESILVRPSSMLDMPNSK